MTAIRILAFSLALLVIAGILAVLRIIQTPARIKKAQEYMDSGDLQKAGEIVKSILKKRENHVPARYIRAQILMKQKQYYLAIMELNAVLALPDFKEYIDQADIHGLLAEMYHETQQYQKEIEEHRSILSFNPNDLRANHRIGHVYYKQLNYGECRDHLARAYTQDPALTDTLVPLGISSYHLADYAGAEQYLLKSLETQADNPEAYYHLGLICKAKKEHEDAIRMFNASKVDRRFSLKSLYGLGEIYLEGEMPETAIATMEEGLESLVDRTDESLAYRYLLAECYEMSNKIKDAVYHWQKILDVDPGYRNTRARLDDYREIMESENRRIMFTSSLEELQPLIHEMIARLNYNIISKSRASAGEYVYKALNVKRISDPPLLICFNRSIRDITETQIMDFHQRMKAENCKSGIYMTTARFSARAKNSASAITLELLDADFLAKSVEKIMAKQGRPGA
jgi:tetratricopeptide (TPR) repeat protein